jgi:peptidoglycan-N-acetylmuramic acid deacetylase
MRLADPAVKWLAGLCAGLAAVGLVQAASPAAAQASALPCSKPVYLTLDTGHMGVAPLIAQVLERQDVKVTFFLANERTQAVGSRPEGSTLDDHWAAWWAEMARLGHVFGSHTWDHLVFQGDRPQGFAFKATAGAQQGQLQTLTAAQYCQSLQRSATRFQAMTGRPMRALFRAPGGKTSPKLLAAAQACGWHHVPWSAAGFLGDELPSDRYPNQQLLARALAHVRPGDIMLAHLGIWSRQDAWAPAVLEPLIVGLKAKGMCFATLADHPLYKAVGDAPTSSPASK